MQQVPSLNHLVGASKDCGWNIDAKLPGGRAKLHKAKGTALQDRCCLKLQIHKDPLEGPAGQSYLQSATLLFSIDATTTSRTDSAVFVRTLRKKPSDVQHLPPWSRRMALFDPKRSFFSCAQAQGSSILVLACAARRQRCMRASPSGTDQARFLVSRRAKASPQREWELSGGKVRRKTDLSRLVIYLTSATLF